MIMSIKKLFLKGEMGGGNEMRRFSENDINEKDLFVIYGAGVYGKFALEGFQFLCKEIGISFQNVNVLFCDTHKYKQKTITINTCKQKRGGVFDIINPKKLKNKEYYLGKIHVIIALAFGYHEVKCELENLDHIIAYDAYYLMQHYTKSKEFNNKIDIQLNTDDLLEKYQFYSMFDREKINNENLVIPWISIPITEKCSLNCKYCISLMPYYGNPANYILKDIKEEIEALIEVSDKIMELQIVGGEPFIYPELADVLDYVVSIHKIKKVTIVTNSTILPNKPLIDKLKNQKIHIIADDYGVISSKYEELLKLCEREKISYEKQKYDNWENVGPIRFRGDDKSKIEFDKQFNICFFKNCMTLIKGKIYRCQYGARTVDLGQTPDDPKDYVNILDKTVKTDIKREKLKSLLVRKEHLTSCEYCKSSSRIPVAEQCVGKQQFDRYHL